MSQSLLKALEIHFEEKKLFFPENYTDFRT